MTTYQVTLPDANDYGTTYVRNLRNASLPQTVDGPPDAQGNPTQLANPALLASNADYVGWLLSQASASWCAQANAAGVVAPGTVPAPPVNSVPQEVTRRQALQQLAIQGLLAKVQPCLDAIPDATQRQLAQIEWDNSNTFERTRPLLVQLGTGAAPYGLGLTDAQLDAIFVAAAKL